MTKTASDYATVNPFFSFPLEEPVSVWDGVICEQQVGYLAAEWSLGKTPLLQQLVLSVADGFSCLGRSTTKRPVLVLDGETPYADYRINLERIAKRLGTSASGIANVNPFLRYGAEGDERSEAFRKVICNQEKAVEYIRQQLTTWPNALVIIDPLLEIIPFKETDTMAALKIYHALRGILADFPHASILFTLHLRKGDDNGDAGSASSAIVLLNNPRRWFKEVSGTNKIGAHADVRLGMCAVAGDEQHLVIKGFRRGKDVPIISFTKSVNGLGEYDGFCESPIPGGVLAGLKPDQISKLKALPFPFRFEEVADQQMPRATLHRLLKAAQAGGCAHKDETGLWQLDLVNEGGEQ